MKKTLFTLGIVFSFVFSARAQTFSFPPIDTIKYGAPTDLFDCTDTVINNSGTGYYIDVVRVVNDTAPFWQTYFCVDQCYAWFVDSARFYILPNGKQHFILDFVTSSMADTTHVLMKFKNVSNPTNTIYQMFYGITYAGFSVNELSNSFNISVFPNPSNGIFTLQSAEEITSVEIYNVLGEKVWSGSEQIEIDLSAQSKGIYFVKVLSTDKVSTQKIVIE